MALSQYDQSVRDAGYKYIPQSQYLLDPFQIPQGSENEVPTGIATTYQAQNMGGGDGGFNPYSPDMSQIRQDYSPYAYRQAMASSGVGIPSGILSDSKFLYAPESKAEGLLNMIPYIGTIKRGAEFLKGMMPINERAIMENEGRGMGIFTDDIGRIVQGSGAYDTGANVMAGYNLSKLTPETIEKRRAKIKETMSKPGYSGDLQKRLDALDEFEEMYFGPTGIKTRTDAIYKYRKDKKAAEKDRKLQEEIDAYNKRQAEIIRRSRDSDNDGVPDYVEDAGGSAPGGMYGTDYQGDSSPSSSGGGGGNPYGGGPGGVQSGMGGGGGASYSSSAQTGAKDGFGYGLADGGRVAYMMGGLTDLVDIYD